MNFKVPGGVLLLMLLFSSPANCLEAADPESAEKLSFDRDIRPILSENCYACHGFDAEAREAGLRLDNRTGAVDDGGAIEPGDAEASLLVDRIFSDDPYDVMPPPDSGRKLTSVQKSKLRQWIDQGAEYETHWAFVPPRSTVQAEAEAGDEGNAVDRFIEAKLASAGLSPSPPADPTTLLRRVSLDLTGLPPKPSQIKEFIEATDRDPEPAYLDLVDRLLSSKHYGERWGRWWLDQARYADSHGYSIDGPREIWLYRDWVIDALNRDMPFDQFTIEQLAGDLLPDATPSQKVATGFHRNTPINQEGGIDREQFRIDSVFDRVATTGTVWLGLSVGCAQCHDHKFDPILQKEFYQLFAFFNDQDEPSIKVYPDDVDADALKSELKGIEAEQGESLEPSNTPLKAWAEGLDDAAVDALAKDVRDAIKKPADKRSIDQKILLLKTAALPDVAAETLETLENLQTRAAEIKRELDRGVSTMVMSERSEPRDSRLLIKGDFTRRDEPVVPGTPSVLHPMETESERANRLDLARWIVSPENPLTPRVIVNRVWQQYFGIGLVETESDFGLQGTSPTHPELLDHLAVDFRANDWSLKELHRQIVLSQTYRQSSRVRSDLHAVDPLNRLYGRQNRLRLDAEIVRDVALVASGMFSPKMGGPPVYPPIPKGALSLGQVSRGWNTSTGEDRYRRGLYTFVFRATPPPALNVFDAPDGQNTCTRRMRSNTPLQALTLMNDTGFFECAQALEQTIETEGVDAAFLRCTSRWPTDEERQILADLDTLTAARAMLNLDETINRE